MIKDIMLGISLSPILSFLIVILTGLGIFSLQESYTQNNIANIDKQKDYFLQEEKLETSLTIQNKIPTLGFDNLLADWQYLQFIQYFGDTPVREKTGYSLVTNYFDLIAKYDPFFVDAYFILSTTNSIYAANPKETVSLLNQVLSQLRPEINPNAFFLWIYKGVDEMLFLGNIEEARKSYEKSAEWALVRGDDEGKFIARRSQETANFLANNPDSKKAQVSAWITILNNAFDDKTRQMAINKIEELGGKVYFSENGKIEIELPQED